MLTTNGYSGQLTILPLTNNGPVLMQIRIMNLYVCNRTGFLKYQRDSIINRRLNDTRES